MQTLQNTDKPDTPNFTPEIIGHMAGLCRRPQMFTSFVTQKTYDIRKAWQLIATKPRRIEALDLSCDAEPITKADIDRDYAGGISSAYLRVPLLVFQHTVPIPGKGIGVMMHIIDGWHRAWRRLSEGNVLTAAFELTADEMDEITFKSPDEIMAYQIAAAAEDDTVIDHDIRQGEKITGIPFAVLKEASLALMHKGKGACLEVLTAAGYNPAPFIKWVKREYDSVQVQGNKGKKGKGLLP